MLVHQRVIIFDIVVFLNIFCHILSIIKKALMRHTFWQFSSDELTPGHVYETWIK